jgi:hypothetical protein
MHYRFLSIGHQKENEISLEDCRIIVTVAFGAIGGFKVSDAMHWLRGCKHIGASARPAPFPILFPIRSGKITFAQFVEFLQKY